MLIRRKRMRNTLTTGRIDMVSAVAICFSDFTWIGIIPSVGLLAFAVSDPP
jgi:hypothetical protein